jgi:hypothetical protein
MAAFQFGSCSASITLLGSGSVVAKFPYRIVPSVYVLILRMPCWRRVVGHCGAGAAGVGVEDPGGAEDPRPALPSAAGPIGDGDWSNADPVPLASRTGARSGPRLACPHQSPANTWRRREVRLQVWLTERQMSGRRSLVWWRELRTRAALDSRWMRRQAPQVDQLRDPCVSQGRQNAQGT